MRPRADRARDWTRPPIRTTVPPPPRAGAGAGAGLSASDVELLALLAEGLPLDAVGRRLQTSERTVRRRTKAICERLGFASSIQAVAWAARRGLV